MDDEQQADERDALAAARETIERQAREIESLQRRLEDERFAKQLRSALALAASVGTIASPVKHSRLLEMIVETAAHIISANAASLFLIDEAKEELVFEVALGQKAAEVKKFRVPLGHGIAGLVAVSGQPIALSEAQDDPRLAADIARSIGYIPQSILCVPLFYNDQIIGALELLDKRGARSFSPADMEALGLFANQAAVAIEQSRTHQYLAALVNEMLGSLVDLPTEEREELQQEVREFAVQIEEDAAYRRTLDLARLVQEIAWQGENELKACQTILQGFADYLRLRPQLAGSLGGEW